MDDEYFFSLHSFINASLKHTAANKTNYRYSRTRNHLTMANTNPITLHSISPREAVADALYRCVSGLDTNDRELFRSAWLNNDNVTFDMDGKVTTGLDGLTNGLLAFIGPLETLHVISNVRVDLKEGSDAAYLTAYALATHYRPGEGMNPAAKALTSGSQYCIDVVKDGKDGVWKVKDWRMHIIWVDGDRSIVGM